VPRWLSLDAGPRSVERTGSSSPEPNLSFRVRSCLSPALHPERFRAPPLGFLSPSRQKRVKSTWRRASHTRLRSALSVSRALDGLLLHAPLRACFIPLPRPGFALQGFSPLPRRLASSTSRALLSLPSFPSRRVAPPLPGPLAPPSGRCSGQRSVVANRGVSPAYHSIPSWAFNSCGLFSGYLGDAFTPPPLMAFPVSHSLSTRRLASSVSLSNRPEDLSPDHLPVRDLRPLAAPPEGDELS
jgi:hypothetical protein